MALVYGGTVGLLSATLFAALAVKSEAKRTVEFGAMALGILMFVLLGRYMVGYPESTQVQRLSAAPGDMLFGEYALALYMVAGLLLAATISIAALTRMVDSDRGE
jgi:NADH:ubiquinone oxidoreductase subunit 6 (subunit J)